MPLHVWDRELDSRLLWAYFLAKNGFDVILGHEYSISSLYGADIPLFHLGAGRPIHNNPRSTNWYPSILENDGFVGLVYEEGINDLSHGPDHHFAGITAQSTASCSRLYGWSSAESSLCMKAAPSDEIAQQISQKYYLSCHTRFELMSPLLGGKYFDKRSSSISEIFGPFMLISDNLAVETFGSNTSMDYKAQYSQFASDERLSQLLEMRRTRYENLSNLRDNFSEIISQVANALPHINFVLRPHPLSNPNYWHSKFHNFRNITTICYEACDPWIFASCGLLHSGCTMGLQAMIAKVPSLDLSLLINDNRSGLSSSIASNKPSSVKELITLICSYVSMRDCNYYKNLTDNYSGFSLSDFLSRSLEDSGLHSLNLAIPSSSRVPEISMSSKLVSDCRDFFSSRQSSPFCQSQSHLDHIVRSIPRIKPNPGKSKTWTVEHIASKVKKYHNIFSSLIKGFDVKIKPTHAPNVFLLRPDRN